MIPLCLYLGTFVKFTQSKYVLSENKNTVRMDIKIYTGVIEKSVKVKLLLGNYTRRVAIGK